MQPQFVTKTLGSASVNSIAQTQTPLAAGNLTLNGSAVTAGVATLDTQRQVLVTQAGNETGHNFTVYGTDDNGTAISEVVAGSAGASVHTNQSFKTVTRVAIDAAATGALQVGTNGVGSTPWYILNWHISPQHTGIGMIVSGTVNYTVQYTYQDPSGTYPDGSQAVPVAFNHATLAAQSTNASGSILEPVAAIRLTVNSGTGTAEMSYLQAGISG